MTIDLEFIVRFLLAALAVYRVAWFTKDYGPFGVFESIRTYMGKMAARETYSSGVQRHGVAWTLAELSNCPHCMGVWLALLFAPFVICPSRMTDIIIIIFALAGIQTYLTRATSEGSDQ
jgi:hypothetical protein